VTPLRDIPLATLRRARLTSQLLAPVAPTSSAAVNAPRAPAVPPAPPRTVAETVGHLLCLQAQDFGQALWAVGARTPGATRADVRAALDAGEVVRTSLLRGTLHFLEARDLRWLLALTAPRAMRSAARRLRETGADAQTIARAAEIARAELRGGGALTRTEFFAALRAAGIAPDGQRGYHLIFALAQAGEVCWGPARGDQPALVLVEEWISRDRDAHGGGAADEADAIGALALRYFTGHGPASVADLAWWTKLPVTAVRAGVAAVRDRLVEVTCEGVTYYLIDTAGSGDVAGLLSAASTRSTSSRPHMLALAAFDEYLLGYQDRSAMLEPRYAERVVPGKNGLFRPIVVADGRVVGTWRKGTDVGARVVAEPFDTLSEQHSAALAEVEAQYAAFLGV
jgi:hypothetical protein